MIQHNVTRSTFEKLLPNTLFNASINRGISLIPNGFFPRFFLALSLFVFTKKIIDLTLTIKKINSPQQDNARTKSSSCDQSYLSNDHRFFFLKDSSILDHSHSAPLYTYQYSKNNKIETSTLSSIGELVQYHLNCQKKFNHSGIQFLRRDENSTQSNPQIAPSPLENHTSASTDDLNTALDQTMETLFENNTTKHEKFIQALTSTQGKLFSTSSPYLPLFERIKRYIKIFFKKLIPFFDKRKPHHSSSIFHNLDCTVKLRRIFIDQTPHDYLDLFGLNLYGEALMSIREKLSNNALTTINTTS